MVRVRDPDLTRLAREDDGEGESLSAWENVGLAGLGDGDDGPVENSRKSRAGHGQGQVQGDGGGSGALEAVGEKYAMYDDDDLERIMQGRPVLGGKSSPGGQGLEQGGGGGPVSK